MKAKGLEISGTFTRQVGSISMDLQLTNKALQVMTDFAIQFNRNRYVPKASVMRALAGDCRQGSRALRDLVPHGCISGQNSLKQ